MGENEKTIFVKEKEKNGKYCIVEGWPRPGKVLSVKRFICDVIPQETDKETAKLADFIIEKLSK